MPKRRSEPDRKWLEVYADGCTRCAVCHCKRGRCDLQLHHIVGRRGRDPHHHRNLIALCRDCHHEGAHGGGERALRQGHILTAKRDEDGEVDVKFLAGLMGRAGLRDDPMPLPEWVVDARKRNHG